MSAPPWANKVKVCIRCKRDCSDIPRIKNPQGQYMCRECYDREALGLRDHPGRGLSGPAGAESPRPCEPDPSVPIEEIVNSGEGLGAGFGAGLSNEVGIEPDARLDAWPNGGPGDPAHAGVDAARDPRMCGHCGMVMHRDAVICTACGMNSRTGLFLTGKPAPAMSVCVKCGYDLRGLPSPRCPECGTINTRAKSLKHVAPRQAFRENYLRPAVYIALGVGVGAGAAWLSPAGSSDDAVLFLKRYTAGVVSCIVGYFICAAIWVGLEAPPRVLAVRIAACWAIAQGAAVLFGLVPMTIVLPYVIAVALLYLMFQDLFEHDAQDSALITLVCAACYIGARIALSKYLS